MTREKILIGFLALLMLYLGATQLIKFFPDSGTQVEQQKDLSRRQAFAVEIATIKKLAPKFDDEIQGRNLRWGRDLFLVQREAIVTDEDVAENPIRASFRLSGILMSGFMARAIINGEVVREGSRVNDYQVTSINQKSVVLVKNRERIVLTMGE